jgi:hypothetical protein
MQPLQRQFHPALSFRQKSGKAVTRWIPGFSSLLLGGKNSGYASHSISPYTMQDIHNLSDTKLCLRTVSWFFTSSEVSNSLRKYISLPVLPENKEPLTSDRNQVQSLASLSQSRLQQPPHTNRVCTTGSHQIVHSDMPP